MSILKVVVQSHRKQTTTSEIGKTERAVYEKAKRLGLKVIITELGQDI